MDVPGVAVNNGSYTNRFSAATINGLTYGGRLTIAPGWLSFEPFSKLNVLPAVPMIVQSDRRVRLLYTRYLPPWYNSFLVIRHTAQSGAPLVAAVRMPGWVRRRLRGVLTSAGFEVDESVKRMWVAVEDSNDSYGA